MPHEAKKPSRGGAGAEPRYQLSQRLAEVGLPPFDLTTIYRTLRQLERTGLVSSFWDTSESGPAKRTYSLTAAGEVFLGNWTNILKRYQALFQWPPPPSKDGLKRPE
jgi:poly-beta-hydroxybutyrate-responsive repressor